MQEESMSWMFYTTVLQVVGLYFTSKKVKGMKVR